MCNCLKKLYLLQKKTKGDIKQRSLFIYKKNVNPGTIWQAIHQINSTESRNPIAYVCTL